MLAQIIPLDFFFQKSMEQTVPRTLRLQLTKGHPTSEFASVDEPRSDCQSGEVEHIFPVAVVYFFTSEFASTK